MDTIGSRVRAEREAAGKTLKEVSAQVGVAISTLSDLEQGTSKGSKHLHKIADALGVSVHWLETGKGDKSPKGKPAVLASQPMRPDPAILIETQTFLDTAFDALGKEWSMHSDADLFAEVYEWVAEDRRPVDERNLADFSKWKATRDQARGGKDDEQDRRTTGEAGREARRRPA